MRESIWSISPRWKTAYFLLFSVQSLAGTGLLSWYEIAHRTEDSAVETVLAIISGVAEVGVAAAVATVVTTEVTQNVMVTGEYLRQKLVEPLKEKQRAEGRAEERAAWEAWNRRRLAAESEGKPSTSRPRRSDRVLPTAAELHWQQEWMY